jgi:hypothetical protein
MSEVPLCGDGQEDQPGEDGLAYRVTSLIRKRLPMGPYSRPMPRALKGSWGVGGFLQTRHPSKGVAEADQSWSNTGVTRN